MAQVKFLKVASGLPTEHTAASDDLTVLSLSTDTINEQGAAAGVTIDGVLLKDSGATFGANVVMGDFSITGIDTLAFTDTAGTVAGIQNGNLLDKSAAETVSGAYTFSTDVNIKEATNDGNPELRVGATDAEELHIQTVYDSGAQTLDYVLFQTDVASATADKGLFRFNVDGTNILDIDDGGLELTGSIGVSGTVDGRDIAADGTKLDGIEELADVTDATNVDAAGAVMNSDTSTAAMSFVIDEDNMASDSATKVPTQQSVKAYVDSQSGGANETYTNANAGSIVLGDVVYMTGTNDEVDLADADTIAQGNTIVGIAAATITTTSSGNIHVVHGKVLAGMLTGATAGTVYYLSATGTSTNTLTTTPPSGGPALVKIGFAKNATDFVFAPQFIADTTA